MCTAIFVLPCARPRQKTSDAPYRNFTREKKNWQHVPPLNLDPRNTKGGRRSPTRYHLRPLPKVKDLSWKYGLRLEPVPPRNPKRNPHSLADDIARFELGILSQSRSIQRAVRKIRAAEPGGTPSLMKIYATLRESFPAVNLRRHKALIAESAQTQKKVDLATARRSSSASTMTAAALQRITAPAISTGFKLCPAWPRTGSPTQAGAGCPPIIASAQPPKTRGARCISGRSQAGARPLGLEYHRRTESALPSRKSATNPFPLSLSGHHSGPDKKRYTGAS